MKNVFTNNHFYPQNFFVKKSENTDIESMLKEISEKAFTISPSSFDAETKYFIFKLRYQPPYIKIPEFREIKNLQIEAISKTRFKNEYNGYIGIDISEWVEHSDEEHFINCIRALRKMSPHWKYVFFVDSHQNNTSIKNMLNFIKSEIWLHELDPIDFSQNKFADRLSKEMKEAHNIRLALTSQKVIKDIFGETDHLNNEIVSNMANDIYMYFGNIKFLPDHALIDYLSDNTYAHFIMTEKEISRLNDLIKEKRIRDDEHHK